MSAFFMIDMQFPWGEMGCQPFRRHTFRALDLFTGNREVQSCQVVNSQICNISQHFVWSLAQPCFFPAISRNGSPHAKESHPSPIHASRKPLNRGPGKYVGYAVIQLETICYQSSVQHIHFYSSLWFHFLWLPWDTMNYYVQEILTDQTTYIA